MSSDPRIASIETFSTADVALVRVTTDDGCEGWGQAAPYNADITAQVLHRQVAPHAIGAVADDLAGLETTILKREFKFPGSYVCRAFGRPGHRALGSARQACRAQRVRASGRDATPVPGVRVEHATGHRAHT